MGAQMVYLPKPVTRKENEEGGDLASEGVRYGVTGMQGWRRSMEDAHLAVTRLDDNISLFGVFDGHGGRGVSRFAAKRLPAIIQETEAYKKGDYARALERAFLAVDERLREEAGRKEVEELDAPDPNGPQTPPMAVPRRVLQRFLGRQGGAGGGGGGGGEDEDEELGPDGLSDEEEELEGGEEDGEAAAAGAPPDGAPAEKKEESTKASAGAAAGGGSPQTSAPPENGVKAEGKVEKPPPGGGSGGAKGEEQIEAADEIELDDDGEDLVVQLADEVAVDGEEDEEELEVDAFMDEDEPCDGEDMALVDPGRLTRDPTPEAQGCTAVVVLLVRATDGEGPRLICANAGDSRAILSRAGEVVALSEDHKPESDIETARITKAGGFVQQMPGGARVQGDLNLSRAMGDLRYKKPENLPPEEQILTAFPEVRTFPLKEEDEFMVLGCDGIWERAGNQEMVDFVRPRIAAAAAETNGQAGFLSKICNEICDKGLCPSMSPQENPDFDGTGCDNMTVVVVQLKSLPATAEAADGAGAGAGAEGADAAARGEKRAAAAAEAAEAAAEGEAEDSSAAAAPAAKKPKTADGAAAAAPNGEAGEAAPADGEAPAAADGGGPVQ